MNNHGTHGILQLSLYISRQNHWPWQRVFPRRDLNPGQPIPFALMTMRYPLRHLTAPPHTRNLGNFVKQLVLRSATHYRSENVKEMQKWGKWELNLFLKNRTGTCIKHSEHNIQVLMVNIKKIWLWNYNWLYLHIVLPPYWWKNIQKIDVCFSIFLPLKK